ncbi:MAG: hypothetical protein LBT62_07765, partial [Deltaproteobacteria bacterium]|nr:hypothetical protein [Deltaproteobacteria bacterium]
MTVSADHTDLPAGFNGHCLRLGKSLSKLLTLSAPALLMAALLMAAAVLWPLAAAAQNNQRVVMILEQNDPPIEVQADEMRHDQQNGRVNFIGNVRLTRGQEIITGDRAIWHDPTNTAEISGNVTLTTADFQATADRAAVNMDLRLAKIYNGRAFFPDRHYYVEGQVLERQGPETLYVNQAVFTTCDGADPSWSISASDLLVNRNGVALASGVLLRNKYFPMFYLPYFMVPIQNDRQTGFLIPSFGNSSRDGFVAATPFFWELAEDYDLTILPYYRSERGMAITVEGRYNLNSGHGIGIVTYLKDKQNNYYNFRNPGGQSRNSRDLFWIRTQNTWTAGEWDINLDLDLVSDPLFLYAFRNDLDGFEYSQQLFSQYFGRTVNEVLDPTRLSTLFAQRFLKDQYFRGSLTYTDNLYRRDNIDTLQNLPKLQYNLVSRPLDLGMDGLQTLGPRLSLDVQYDYFSRKSNDLSDVSETGHRLYVSPQLFFNKNLGQWLSLKADAGLNLAAYAPTGLRPSELGPT